MSNASYDVIAAIAARSLYPCYLDRCADQSTGLALQSEPRLGKQQIDKADADHWAALLNGDATTPLANDNGGGPRHVVSNDDAETSR